MDVKYTHQTITLHIGPEILSIAAFVPREADSRSDIDQLIDCLIGYQPARLFPPIPAVYTKTQERQTYTRTRTCRELPRYMTQP